MNLQRPLLSVCIPTYNRADWLEPCLRAWLAQINATEGLAELVVSDNCSPDATPVVIEAALAHGPFRCHRNATNIGSNPNIYQLVSELAHGEYVWVLGDDDIVTEDGLTRVLAALREHPDIDFFCANYAVWLPSEPPSPSLSPQELLRLGEPRRPELADRRVERLEELVAGDANCFTPIYSFIMRRPLACRAFEKSLVGEPFSSVESVFSHAVFIAEHLIKQPAWYIGYPCVISSQAQSWNKYWPICVLDLIPRLYDCFERGGVSPQVLDAHRRTMLAHSGGPLWQMLTQRETARRAQFSPVRFLWKHRHFPEFRTELLPVCRHVLAGRLPRPLRWAWRLLRLLAQPSRALRRLRRLAASVARRVCGGRTASHGNPTP